MKFLAKSSDKSLIWLRVTCFAVKPFDKRVFHFDESHIFRKMLSLCVFFSLSERIHIRIFVAMLGRNQSFLPLQWNHILFCRFCDDDEKMENI